MPSSSPRFPFPDPLLHGGVLAFRRNTNRQFFGTGLSFVSVFVANLLLPAGSSLTRNLVVAAALIVAFLSGRFVGVVLDSGDRAGQRDHGNGFFQVAFVAFFYFLFIVALTVGYSYPPDELWLWAPSWMIASFLGIVLWAYWNLRHVGGLRRYFNPHP